MKKYKAFLFDLNGTMISDMGYHIAAWQKIVNDLGAEYSLEQMKDQCYGKGEEVLERIFPGRYELPVRTEMCLKKELQYQQDYRPYLKLIDGLDAFLATANKAGVKMAIGSAAITSNIDFVLDGLNIRHYFDAIISADNVTMSKPHPETFLEGASQLGIDVQDCIVFEDAPKGVEAAQKAAIDCAALTTMHCANEFGQYENIVSIQPNFVDWCENNPINIFQSTLF